MKSLTARPGFGAYARASAIAGLAAAPAAALADFSDPYALIPPPPGSYSGVNAEGTFGAWTGNWNDAGPVTLDTTGAPNQLSLSIGSPISAAQDGNYTFLVQAVDSGLVSFDYATSLNNSPGFGASAAFINQSTATSTPLTGSGPFSIAVAAGDLFGFQVSFNYQATAALTVSNFSAPVPEGGTLSLLALGFVGLLAHRAAARRRSVIGG